MSHNNTSNASGWANGGDTIVHVEQGPEWLANLLYNPPHWAQRTLPLVLAVVGVAAMYAVWKVGLPEDAYPDMAENIAVAACVALTTTVMTHLPGGYAVDLVVGLVVGYSLAVVGVRRVVAPKLWPDVSGNTPAK